MDIRMGASAPNQVFEDFVPRSDLVSESDADILQIHLPDFRKEQLRVQVTKSGILRISGQKHKGGDRWVRFHKEFPISPNINQNKITAKYDKGILSVRQPKNIIPTEKQEKSPASEPVHPQPPKPAADEQRRAGEEQSKKAEEKTKGEETKPSQPQKSVVNEQKTGEEPSKKAEEQAKHDSPVSEPKMEKTDTKSATERSVEAKKSAEDEMTSKSTSTKKDSSDTKNAVNSVADLATMLRQPRKILNVALVVLVVVGIGLYVNNMIRSSGEAEE